ncbi:MAG: ABC-F family ATP-binding cassette domain-containing protein [Eubacterium sp.]|nr:ABC-F family ATP-binding cassette domain-containing protein [Eubacterium sp.]
MIRVENLSYSFPEKDLYRNISFHIEEGQHAALIGSNGSGKTTLIDMIIHEDEYLYTGKIRKKEPLKTGYVSQYVVHDRELASNVYDYLAQDFRQMLQEQEAICLEMESATDFEEIMERYQASLDAFTAVDGENYETNIHKQLKLAGLSQIEEVPVSRISGGEFKLMQIIRQMMRFPDLLIMDEPDVFLDFDNLSGLANLILSYPKTVLVVTHNRFLLNYCFDKILHLEDMDIQEFDGSYMDYQVALLSRKVEMQEGAARDQKEILRQQKVVERIRKEATYIDNSAKGRQLKARVSLLERLKEKAIKEPFVEVREPEIHLWMGKDENLPGQEGMSGDSLKGGRILVEDYSLSFGETLLEHVSFEIGPGEKVALVGPNGTGKTTLLHDIYEMMQGKHPSGEENDMATQVAYLSQIYQNIYNESETLYQVFERLGFEKPAEIEDYLSKYCFPPEMAGQRLKELSGGERNLLALAILGRMNSEILLLDEPSSHLDLYAQEALERAIREYPGTVLMVSHDFYTIANCVDYVLYVEDRQIRRMSGRAFRKMIYKRHFSSRYMEFEKEKKELEQRIQSDLRGKDYEKAKEGCRKLAALVDGAPDR